MDFVNALILLTPSILLLIAGYTALKVEIKTLKTEVKFLREQNESWVEVRDVVVALKAKDDNMVTKHYLSEVLKPIHEQLATIIQKIK